MRRAGDSRQVLRGVPVVVVWVRVVLEFAG
jgi:hypothetical protein